MPEIDDHTLSDRDQLTIDLNHFNTESTKLPIEESQKIID